VAGIADIRLELRCGQCCNLERVLHCSINFKYIHAYLGCNKHSLFCLVRNHDSKIRLCVNDNDKTTCEFSLANLKMHAEKLFPSWLSYQKLALGKHCIKTICDLKFPWLSYCIYTHWESISGVSKCSEVGVCSWQSKARPLILRGLGSCPPSPRKFWNLKCRS